MLFNSALLLCLIHGYRYSPPRYLVTVYSLSLSASFNRPYTSGHSSCCPTDPVSTAVLRFLESHVAVKNPRCGHIISVSQVILSYPRSHIAVPHYRRRRPHLRHESQHPSFAGAQPLERAYCHESMCYISNASYSVDFA